MPPADPSAGAGRRILVVEDEYLVAEHIREMLEDLGYEVVGPVPTVPEAIRAIAGEKLDAVFLDVNLGGTSSAPVADELAAAACPSLSSPATAILSSPPPSSPPPGSTNPSPPPTSPPSWPGRSHLRQE